MFLAHGTDDGVIPFKEGLSSWDWLKSRGHHVNWHNYSMMHSVCAEEIADISQWLCLFKNLVSPCPNTRQEVLPHTFVRYKLDAIAHCFRC